MGGASVSDPPAHYPFGCCLLGVAPHCLDSCDPGRCRGYPLEPQTAEEPLLLASHLDQRGVGQTQCNRTLLWPRLPLLSFATASSLWLVHHGSAGRPDVHRYHHRRVGSATGGASRSHSLSQTRFSSYVGGVMS